jgi:protein-disulfide isomerase
MNFLSLKKLSAAAILAGFALSSQLTMPAFAKTFDDADKTAIQGIVKDYLLKNPEIIREALIELERRTAEAEKNRQKKLVAENQALLTDPKYAHIAGNEKGDITVVEFFDYNCPYCRQSLKDIEKLMDADKNVRVIFKEYPILGKASTTASIAALASRKQGKYMEFHTALLSAKGRINDEQITSIAKTVGLDVDKLKSDMKSADVLEAHKKNMEVGQKLGINGTPTFIFNDQVIPQVLPFEAMKQLIARIRKAS